MTDVRSDEKVVVAKSSINIGVILAAIVLLLLVVGILRLLGVSPL